MPQRPRNSPLSPSGTAGSARRPGIDNAERRLQGVDDVRLSSGGFANREVIRRDGVHRTQGVVQAGDDAGLEGKGWRP
jgi:hypothetical protein